MKGGFLVSLALKDQYDKIYRFCYFKVKNTQLAEDLTQETFLKFFSQSTYISRGKPLAYLYTIARNLCMEVYRKKEILPLHENVTAESDFEHAEASIAIRQAVSTLAEDLQEIVLLRFVNDLSINEISKITHMSRFAVYRKINYALNKLKQILREEDFS